MKSNFLKTLILSIIVLLMLTSCSKDELVFADYPTPEQRDEQADKEALESALLGEWVEFRTVDGNGKKYTPSTPEKLIEFNGDEVTLTLIKNGSQTSETANFTGEYLREMRPSKLTLSPKIVELFGNSPDDDIFYFLDFDEVFINNSESRGYTIFKRK